MVFRYVVNLSYGSGGGPGVNVWHFRGPSVGNDSQLVVNAINGFYGGLNNLMAPGMVVTGPSEVVAGIEGDSPTFEPVTGWTVNAAAGSNTTAPPVLQIVAGWRTALASRSGRGRTFLGPFNTSVLDVNGTPTNSAIGLVNEACQEIVDFNGGVDDGAIGVWSPTDGVIRDITGFRVRDTFAVLRSRRD